MRGPRDPHRRRRARRRRSRRWRCSPKPPARASTPGTPAEMLAVAERARARLPDGRLGSCPVPGRRRDRDGADLRRRRAPPERQRSARQSARRVLVGAARRPPAAAVARDRADLPPRGRRRAFAARPCPAAARDAGRGRSPALRAQSDRPRPGHHRSLGASPRRHTARRSSSPARAASRPSWRSRCPDLPGCRRAVDARRSAARARAEAFELSSDLGTSLLEVWATAALGELELGLGDVAAAAAEHFEHQQRLLRELRSPMPTCRRRPNWSMRTCGWARCRRRAARAPSSRRSARPRDSRGHWPARCAARAWSRRRGRDAPLFEHALGYHERTPDAFETARTRLAYGERLRRARNRVLAREQFRAAIDDVRTARRCAVGRARPRRAGRDWGDGAAPGPEHRRRADAARSCRSRSCSPAGKTTREAAAALFLSPKTIEYHLRHVYQKLGIHSREELGRTLATSLPQAPVDRL